MAGNSQQDIDATQDKRLGEIEKEINSLRKVTGASLVSIFIIGVVLFIGTRN